MNRFTGINSIEGCILYDCRQSRARVAALGGGARSRSLARRDRRSGRRGAENWEDLVGRLRLTSGPCPPPPRHCTTPQVRWALPCCCLINGLTGEISGGERLSPGFHTSFHHHLHPQGVHLGGGRSQGGASSRVLASHDGGQKSW